jgi:hypothetical protein
MQTTCDDASRRKRTRVGLDEAGHVRVSASKVGAGEANEPGSVEAKEA